MNLIHPLIIFSVDSPVAFDLENRLRHEFVRDVLKHHGLTFVEGVGKATSGGGACEKPLCVSFVVWDDNVSAQDTIVGIALQFDQDFAHNTVLCVDSARVAYLIHLGDDSREVVGTFRAVSPHKAAEARNYTLINGLYYVAD